MKDENFYRRKREDVRRRKRELEKIEFKSSDERKKRKDDLKREYRALKQSERDTIKKEIEKEINGD